MRAAVLSIALAALTAVNALAACGAGAPAPLSNRAAAPAPAALTADDAATANGAATIARLQRFSSDMCECQDRDCVDRVVDAMTRWAQDLARAGEANPRVNRAEDTQARAAAEKMTRCMSAVYARRAGSGSTR